MKLPLYVDRGDCYLKYSRKSKPTKRTDKDAGIFLDQAWEIGWRALRYSKSIPQAENYIKRAVAEHKREFLKGLEGESGYNATNHGNNNDDHFGEIGEDAYKVFLSTLKHWRNQDTYDEHRPKQAAEQEIEREANRARRAARLSNRANAKDYSRANTTQRIRNSFNSAVASGTINLRSYSRKLNSLTASQHTKYRNILNTKRKAARTKKNSPKKLSSINEESKVNE